LDCSQVPEAPILFPGNPARPAAGRSLLVFYDCAGRRLSSGWIAAADESAGCARYPDSWRLCREGRFGML